MCAGQKACVYVHVCVHRTTGMHHHATHPHPPRAFFQPQIRSGSPPCTLRHLPSQRYAPFLQDSRVSFYFFPLLFFASTRDGCSCGSAIFSWVFSFLCGFREVWDEWCMVSYAGSRTRIGCYRHDSVLWYPSPQCIRLSPRVTVS